MVNLRAPKINSFWNEERDELQFSLCTNLRNIVQLYNFRICANLQEVALLTFWVDKAHVKNHKMYHLYTYEKYCTSPTPL